MTDDSNFRLADNSVAQGNAIANGMTPDIGVVHILDTIDYRLLLDHPGIAFHSPGWSLSHLKQHDRQLQSTYTCKQHICPTEA